MTMNKTSVLLCMALLAPVAVAGVYKYVDEQGNTVYTDTKPKTAAPEDVEKLNVRDNYSNSYEGATSPVQSPKDASDVYKDIQYKQEKEATLAQQRKTAKHEAKKAIDAAAAALEDAKQVKSGDMFPNPGGGIRYTQQYLERIEAAQMNLDKAQKHYNEF